MGTFHILSKSSNNSYNYTDSEDSKLTANGNFEMDEQEKRVLSANGNIFYNGMSIANFSTSMYNGVLQYQLYGTTAENTENAFKALSGVQEQLKSQVAGEENTETEQTTDGSETGTAETAATAEDAESETDKK